MLGITLDRDDPTPLHHQLTQALTDAIAHGDLPPGSPIDGEMALCEELGVSRTTVRLALTTLVRHGLLVRRPHHGTRVVDLRDTHGAALDTGRIDPEDREDRAHTTVLLTQMIPATAEVAAQLAVPAGQPVLHLRRLRRLDRQPLAVLENFLPGRLAAVAGQNLATTGLYTALERAGIRMALASDRIGARQSTPNEQRLLGQPHDPVVLTRDRVVHDDQARPVLIGRHVYRGDRYTYLLTVVGGRTDHAQGATT